MKGLALKLTLSFHQRFLSLPSLPHVNQINSQRMRFATEKTRWTP